MNEAEKHLRRAKNRKIKVDKGVAKAKIEKGIILTFDDCAAQKRFLFEKVEKCVILAFNNAAAQNKIVLEKAEKGGKPDDDKS